MASSLQRKEKEGEKTYIHVAKLQDQQQETKQETKQKKQKHKRTTKHNAKQHRVK